MEIERKFLVPDLSAVPTPERTSHIVQAYLRADSRAVVRIRILDEQAFLCVKSPTDTSGLSRDEYEYPIPLEDAKAMMSLCLPGEIEKQRMLIRHEGLCWEVDVFSSPHEGLVIAEIELSYPDQQINLPPWVGKEVTGDPQYYNANLIHV
ncbi:Uncharacterized protein conserved in bacteria [Porphyromonas crevioricanis]|uniref:Uncharacterized protein conserved in bacteria n=1 Tax=Porphyromonas crevioricanis TaxID=393921 RepID=A0A2X4PKQ2_9PORP|nr:CYTH domain-containing protein [Porphyromonas crevioricanis]GAD08457.1 hypothetical protein PORCAN_2099 [Porphyromonas crevioricanis JCM 13913]SQH72905.1 Uncharacterized protein conserved in bacteria [Porphyromonas crevioricanis]